MRDRGRGDGGDMGMAAPAVKGDEEHGVTHKLGGGSL